MKLVDEIIEMAADGTKPLGDALRKCLMLAFELKNEALKEWVEKELNGYKSGDEIPEYRKAVLFSRGNFVGPFGAWAPKRPLPMSILEPKHRSMLSSSFRAPIASYEGLGSDKNGELMINWPPDLIVHYQDKFIEGFALSQAWQEVPSAMVVGLCEQVRNRLLRFALEIRGELGSAGDEPAKVPQDKVQAAVVNHIYGGVTMIGVEVVAANIGSVVVAQGNLESLKAALESAGIPHDEVARLESAIAEDNKGGEKGIGKKSAEWLGAFGKKATRAGFAVGQEVAKEWLLQYLGLK